MVNVGDSRCITLTQNGQVVITKDHKPDDYEELSRINNSGGFVVKSRVNGTLSMSRSLGDFKEGIKLRMGNYMGILSPVSPLPDIYSLSLPPVKAVLATDGLWDIIGSDEVVELFIWAVNNKKCIDNVIYNIVRKVINDVNSKDNITVITVNI
jgi:serine/threonine protein phosphatase PrpC